MFPPSSDRLANILAFHHMASDGLARAAVFRCAVVDELELHDVE